MIINKALITLLQAPISQDAIKMAFAVVFRVHTMGRSFDLSSDGKYKKSE